MDAYELYREDSSYRFNSNVDESNQPEHAFEGMRYVECANYEGSVLQCLCGERFVDRSELDQHIADEKRRTNRPPAQRRREQVSDERKLQTGRA